MLPLVWQNRFRRLAEGAALPLARLGITPNSITILGFLLTLVTAGVIATDHLTQGAILLFVAGIFDMLDGALARATQQGTTFGAFLDSVLDRYSEAAILLALVVVFSHRHDTAGVALSYLVAFGSLMVSYSRARAEGLGLNAKVGLAARPERIIILGLGLLFTPFTVLAALVILAALTNITALQRLVHVYRITRAEDPAAPS